MAQYISKGNIFGRIGTNLGKGLAEQLPKEVERGRLAAGLKDLSERKDQTPFEKFSGLAATAHEYPQIVHSGSELLKQQGIRNSFAKSANGGMGPGGGQPGLPKNIAESLSQIGPQRSPRGAVYNPQSETEGKSLGENPVRPEAIPAKPWSDDRWINEMAQAQERFPDLNNQELMALVDRKQQRELAAPEAEQAIDAYKEAIQDKANTAFDDALALKLEKSGVATYADVPGTLQNKIKRKMVNELIENPNANIKDVADKWSDMAFRRTKALGDLKVDANKGFFSKSPKEVISNLNARSQLFKDLGDSENYRDTIISNFNFSPQRASQIAFHPSKSAQSFLDSRRRTVGTLEAMNAGAIKSANDLTKSITPSDSVQSIARSIKDKDPYFNESLFFQQLKDVIADDERNSPFTDMQKEEISQGGADSIPHWADIWYFPIPHGISSGGKK